MKPTDRAQKLFNEACEQARSRLAHITVTNAFGQRSIEMKKIEANMARHILFDRSRYERVYYMEDYFDAISIAVVVLGATEVDQKEELAVQTAALEHSRSHISMLDSYTSKYERFALYHAAVNDQSLVPYIEAGVSNLDVVRAGIAQGVTPDLVAAL